MFLFGERLIVAEDSRKANIPLLAREDTVR